MFAEMPLDNCTVVKFAAVAAIAGFYRLPGMSPRSRQGQNDLMFRRGWQFCNFEPKICQYG
jgi:hypothetical protein